MRQNCTVSLETLAVLSSLGKHLLDFYLAGGTALALYFQHRQSDDLDFFSEYKVEPQRLLKEISQFESSIENIRIDEGTLLVNINQVKVSFMEYQYPLLKPFNHWEKNHLASIEDIACMKMIAIASRSERKDYYDLFEILKTLSPRDILENLQKKYGSQLDLYPFIIALTYFSETEQQIDPKGCKENWIQVKTFMEKIQKDFYQIAKSLA
jgi:predicted nucleotidyltransferase component of viral defense system